MKGFPSFTREKKKKSRQHNNKMQSLELMLQNKTKDDFVLQKVFLHPRGIMLWSLKSVGIFWELCQEDILYIDATGSIKKKEEGVPPFYVYMKFL